MDPREGKSMFWSMASLQKESSNLSSCQCQILDSLMVEKCKDVDEGDKKNKSFQKVLSHVTSGGVKV